METLKANKNTNVFEGPMKILGTSF